MDPKRPDVRLDEDDVVTTRESTTTNRDSAADESSTDRSLLERIRAYLR